MEQGQAQFGTLNLAYQIKLTDEALRQLTALPAHVKKRIARWLDLLAEDPLRRPSRQLEGHPELRRVHASKVYLIVYAIVHHELVVLVIRIAHRRDVYKRL